MNTLGENCYDNQLFNVWRQGCARQNGKCRLWLERCCDIEVEKHSICSTPVIWPCRADLPVNQSSVFFFFLWTEPVTRLWIVIRVRVPSHRTVLSSPSPISWVYVKVCFDWLILYLFFICVFCLYMSSIKCVKINRFDWCLL